MTSWKTILATGAILLVAAPVAQAQIPRDEGAPAGASHRTVQATKRPLPKLIANQPGAATAVERGAYNQHAYVPGGSSQKVARAITADGKLTANRHRVRTRTIVKTKKVVEIRYLLVPATSPSSGPGVGYCTSDSPFCDAVNCELWAIGCVVEGSADETSSEAATSENAASEAAPAATAASEPMYAEDWMNYT